eukprot:scaffold10723_cov164-Amphora_coffeaeformis.AAC.9
MNSGNLNGTGNNNVHVIAFVAFTVDYVIPRKESVFHVFCQDTVKFCHTQVIIVFTFARITAATANTAAIGFVVAAVPITAIAPTIPIDYQWSRPTIVSSFKRLFQ